jgi:hypothetical protein
LGYEYSVAATGSGTGTSNGVGGIASIPAGAFAFVTTGPIVPPLLAIDGYGVGAPGQVGSGPLPLDPGTSKALSWNGVTGTMGLSASFYLISGVAGTTPQVVAGIPLAIVGVGATQKFSCCGGILMGTVKANPYQLGVVMVTDGDDYWTGSPTWLTGTGFDNRTQNGYGVLQLVSPTVVHLGALGSLAGLATLTIEFYVPEPATLGLLGLGLVVLGALRRRNAAR